MEKETDKMEYEDMTFKIPQESPDYEEQSNFVVKNIEAVIADSIEKNTNKIVLNTSLKLGLPLENINKIAGPMIEAWAAEIFTDVRDDLNNPYHLINVDAQPRLGMADIVLQFKQDETVYTGNVDVKATAGDIPKSGRGPNITSFHELEPLMWMTRILCSSF